MKESDIQRQILDYLKIKKIFAWRNNNGAVFDPRCGKYRKNPQALLGVSDIIGIIPKTGLLLAIEVKSEKGTVSTEQEYFIERIRAEGGISFVARSVEDVIKYLDDYALLKTRAPS